MNSGRSSPLVAIENLTVAFRQGDKDLCVLHGIDFAIDRGEAVGLVGESGSGKSVTWLAAVGLLDARARVSGSVKLDGLEILHGKEPELAKVRGKRIAMIFQDPTSSLNPVHRIGTQIIESLKAHRGMSHAAAKAEARRLLDRAHIPAAAQRLQEYPHELSGGMNQRVMIAIALAGEPDLLIADEPTTALDVTIQAQILELLKEMRRDTGMALVIISHDLGVVSELADRVCVMYAGRIVEQAPTGDIFDAPRHPYTHGLLSALPEISGPRKRLDAIPGQVPEPLAMPSGCAFAPRCGWRLDECEMRVPPLAHVAARRLSACPRSATVQARRPAISVSGEGADLKREVA